VQELATDRTVLVPSVLDSFSGAFALALISNAPTDQQSFAPLFLCAVPILSVNSLTLPSSRPTPNSLSSRWRATLTPAAVPEVSAMVTCHLLSDTS
jgi:hypothetical protein